MVIVAIECASWYQREDGIIQVITIRGKTVILNRSYSKVWLAIDDERSYTKGNINSDT